MSASQLLTSIWSCRRTRSQKSAAKRFSAIGRAAAMTRAKVCATRGEATAACVSDSKKFGAWDQNLLTEWHARYGGRGVMIYWHVEKKSVCIHSQ